MTRAIASGASGSIRECPYFMTLPDRRSDGRMTWTTVTLELAATADFPRGSVARSYVLRLPLREDGLVDEAALQRHPELATARRFWPNEPDRHGYARATAQGWAFAADPVDAPVPQALPPIRRGALLMLTEPDGGVRPYEVKNCRRG
jgi:hypothetical protein